MRVIGTAGWAIPRAHVDAFPADGSALQRYAARFAGTEVNSSFYRPHRRSTWERWGVSVPAHFRFSAKIPRTISHERRLIDCAEPLARFIDEVSGLGDKLGVLLLQLPPKLAFDAAAAERFLALATRTAPARLACEPRHPSWFAADADALLDRYGVARVAADPAVVPAAAMPGGWRGLAYHRLHGAPDLYRSRYDDVRLAALATALDDAEREGRAIWCVFDNTASGAATGDAMRLRERM